MKRKKTEFFVNRRFIYLLNLLLLIALLVGCVDLSKNSPNSSQVKKIEIAEKAPDSDPAIKINEAFAMLNERLSIPVLKPTYLPKGYFVSADFDVHENSGSNPRILSDDHAEVELEKEGYSAASEYGHRWLRFSFGSSVDLANYSTPGVYVNGSPAMFVGGKTKSWAIISWMKVWKGRKIRYAVEGSGVSGSELIKIANSMKQLD